MQLSRAKATLAILCGAAGLALTAGHLNIRPARPEIVHLQAMRLFATSYIKASWMRSTGANRTSGARAGAQSQIGWHSLPGTNSHMRRAKTDAGGNDLLWRRCSHERIHPVILSSEGATAVERLAERQSFAVGSKPASSARGRRQTFCLSPRHVALALESPRPSARAAARAGNASICRLAGQPRFQPAEDTRDAVRSSAGWFSVFPQSSRRRPPGHS